MGRFGSRLTYRPRAPRAARARPLNTNFISRLIISPLNAPHSLTMAYETDAPHTSLHQPYIDPNRLIENIIHFYLTNNIPIALTVRRNAAF